MARDLRHDMSRRAETIAAEPRRSTDRRVSRDLERAVTDQSGAQQRRRLGIAIALGDGKHVARIGHRVLSVAAVDLIAGEERVIAEIFAARAAIEAGAVGVAEPR